MARTNGPFVPSGAALQRRPGHDPFGAPAAPAGQWPTHPQQGYGTPAPTPSQSLQGYHFPPPEPEPTYGYTPQPLGGQQQWGQPADPNGYELSYQAYNAADPPPFQNHHQPQQGYPDQDADYGGEEYFEDEEPRRGKRWILIAAALVGAIGVGGALAYTYRSLVAPGPGRVPIAKVDSAAKAKPDYRGASGERKLPTSSAEEASPSASEPPRDEPPADTANVGPRVVRPIPISPGGVATAPEPPVAPTAAVPGITLYRPPQLPQPQAQAPALPPPPPPAQAMPAPQPPARAVLGTRPPAAETEDEPPAMAAKRPPVQTAALNPASPKAPPAKPATSGLGYVAVLSSKKSSMEALQAFADMQQEHPEVLGDKTPDVQAADLSERGLGTMYRLVVGPPGSHNAARSVCAQLKRAGYEGCWVKEF